MSREICHFSDCELLLWIDGEMAPRPAAEVHRHLGGCPACRARATQLETAISGFLHLYQSDLNRNTPPADAPETLFKARLAQYRKPSDAARQILAAAAIAAVFMAVGAALNTRESYTSAIPNVLLTPGSTSAVNVRDVCSGNSAANDPELPAPLKQQVLKEYGLSNISNQAYEFDYLVTPQLGGAVNIRNLWPQPSFTTVWNARVKDELEDRLHSLVCSGQLDLPTAQRDLSQDWVAAYRKYFRTREPRAVS